MNTKKYWKNRGKTYYNEAQTKTKAFKKSKTNQEKKLIKIIKNTKFKTLLDVGCGYGRLLKKIQENTKNKKLTGIDISPDQINKAKELTKNTKLICKDFTKYKDKKKYDIILCSEVLVHIPPKEINKFIKKIKKLSKKKIILIEQKKSEHTIIDKIIHKPHVFIHDLEKIITKNKLKIKKQIKTGLEKQYIYIIEVKK